MKHQDKFTHFGRFTNHKVILEMDIKRWTFWNIWQSFHWFRHNMKKDWRKEKIPTHVKVLDVKLCVKPAVCICVCVRRTHSTHVPLAAYTAHPKPQPNTFILKLSNQTKPNQSVGFTPNTRPTQVHQRHFKPVSFHWKEPISRILESSDWF